MNFHKVFSADGYEVISANAKKRCNKNENRRDRKSHLTITNCKQNCDQAANCTYFAFVVYVNYNVCKTYNECEESALEDANNHQTIYKKIEGKQNK